MITRVEKVTVYVSSQEDAERFWVDQVGFMVSLRQPMGPGMTWLEVSPKGGGDLTALELYSKELMMQQNPAAVCAPSFILASDDPAAEWEALQAKGVHVTELQKMPYGTMFSFLDNDGNSYMARG
jgi:uncharacterized glyoxalase superfamily protein PhnB